MAREPLRPSKFITVLRGYLESGSASEAAALNAAERVLNSRNRQTNQVAIYQLIKVVRIVPAPVQVETVAICSEKSNCKDK